MIGRRRSIAARGLCVAGLALGLGAKAWASDPYDSMTPKMGDGHRHVGTLRSVALVGLGFGCLDDQFGPPDVLYADARAGGYDWINFSHHSFSIADTQTNPRYQWFVDPSSAPVVLTGLQSPHLVPNANGLPDYQGGTLWDPTDPGSDPSLAWNEALSLSKAAEAANDPPNFLALSGREYTPEGGRMRGFESEKGGHKVIFLPGESNAACHSRNALSSHVPDQNDPCLAPDATPNTQKMFDWAESLGGVVIQAHPNLNSGDGTNGDWEFGIFRYFPTLDTATPPRWGPGGMSEAHLSGMEVATARRMLWERAYQTALSAGFRLFPSLGTDLHRSYYNQIEGGPSCSTQRIPNKIDGGTVCWLDNTNITRLGLMTAMKQRRCYASGFGKGIAKLKMRPSGGATWSTMGDIVNIGTTGDVEVSIVRDPDVPANFPRYSTVEVVHVRGPGSDPIKYVKWRCTTEGSNPACLCEVKDTKDDSCVLTRSAQVVEPGAYYARVCHAPPGKGCIECHAPLFCDDQLPNRSLLVTAPVFVNFEEYSGCDGSTADADGDGWLDCRDNCPQDPNAAQADLDRDGIGDDCDDDADGDLVLANDNCPLAYNPAHAGPYDCDGDGLATKPDEQVGAQCDEDGDGRGDECDNCPFVPNPGQENGDENELGDACQCGDVATGTPAAPDGILDVDDLLAILQSFSLPPPGWPAIPPGNFSSSLPGCDVTGDGLCDFEDALNVYFAVHESDDSICATPTQCALSPVSDNDGIPNAIDNCRMVDNPDQLDCDNDGVGWACDASPGPDTDGDGVPDGCDNCPVPNANQADCDGDGIGDVCDTSNPSPDTDGDLVPDICDNCPIPNPDQADCDADGVGDACETDPKFQLDSDGDGLADACECGDFTEDGIVNSLDARLIQRCSVGAIPCTGLCDVTGEGDCNSVDARLVQRVSVGEIDPTELRCRGPVDTSDCDEDKLNNRIEEFLSGAMLFPDRDMDGLDDFQEVQWDTALDNDDTDGDGLKDGVDLCKVWPSTNVDTDGDMIGDECQCGDQGGPSVWVCSAGAGNPPGTLFGAPCTDDADCPGGTCEFRGSGPGTQDGKVGLLDIFAVNEAILNQALVTELCDGNNDSYVDDSQTPPVNVVVCNLQDIFAVNDIILGNCVGGCLPAPNNPPGPSNPIGVPICPAPSP